MSNRLQCLYVVFPFFWFMERERVGDVVVSIVLVAPLFCVVAVWGQPEVEVPAPADIGVLYRFLLVTDRHLVFL